MPAHPVSRLVRFTLAVGTNVIFDHLGYRRPTVHPVRMIEAVELVGCHVGRYLAQEARNAADRGTLRRRRRSVDGLGSGHQIDGFLARR